MNKTTQIERLKTLAEMSQEYDVIEEIVAIIALRDELKKEIESEG